MIPPETLREVINGADVTIERERWPKVRSGEREPLPNPLRLAIYRRDNYSCRICHRSDEAGTVEIDHIIPWSAGGPDTSENLRLLCGPCNQRRSNWNDGAHTRPVRPVTWWCIECWTSEHRTWRADAELDRYYLVDPDTADIVAFCAYCRHLSRTDVTL